ncbi:MAG: lipocalin-like domain-containing protein [Candidatus Marinamargulisbacteria bacterium]
MILSMASFGFKPVTPLYPWAFPRDHGAHLDYGVEWWYFTGHLMVGEEMSYNYGFEFTMFRIGNTFHQERTPWAFNHIFVTHFTLTDDQNDRFYESEFSHREAAGFSEAKVSELSVKNGPFQVYSSGNAFVISAEKGDHALQLALKNTKPIVFHGDRGFHQKTQDKGAASYYYSMTRLVGDGTLVFNGQERVITRAEAWMDHEVFTPDLTDTTTFGWDWFAIQFDDQTELMIYQLRDANRLVLPTASGSFVSATGAVTPVVYGEYTLTPLAWWTDPKTQVKYPVQWRVEVPKLGIHVVTNATVNHQMVHPTSILQQTNYWEGKCDVTGSHRGKAYVELVGYQ